MVDGTKTPFSTVLMVLRDTETFAANSAWVRPSSARASLSRLRSDASATLVGRAFKRREKPRGPDGAKEHRSHQRMFNFPHVKHMWSRNLPGIDERQNSHEGPIVAQLLSRSSQTKVNNGTLTATIISICARVSASIHWKAAATTAGIREKSSAK